jgi:hypothetical protein
MKLWGLVVGGSSPTGTRRPLPAAAWDNVDKARSPAGPIAAREWTRRSCSAELEDPIEQTNRPPNAATNAQTVKYSATPDVPWRKQAMESASPEFMGAPSREQIVADLKREFEHLLLSDAVLICRRAPACLGVVASAHPAWRDAVGDPLTVAVETMGRVLFARSLRLALALRQNRQVLL